MLTCGTNALLLHFRQLGQPKEPRGCRLIHLIAHPGHPFPRRCSFYIRAVCSAPWEKRESFMGNPQAVRP